MDFEENPALAARQFFSRLFPSFFLDFLLYTARLENRTHALERI